MDTSFSPTHMDTDKRFFLPMKTVLIVEDKWDVIENILIALGGMFKVIVVRSPAALRSFVGDYTPGLIDAAIFDAQLGGKDHTSFTGLKELRQAGFTGPILANSSTDNPELLKHGATVASEDKGTAGAQIISMMLEQAAEWIPQPIRNLINLYSEEKWYQLVSLMRMLSPDQITQLEEKLYGIIRSDEAPDKYTDGAYSVRTAIEHVGDYAELKQPSLDPDFDAVLIELRTHLK